jgi:hypothetical protein
MATMNRRTLLCLASPLAFAGCDLVSSATSTTVVAGVLAATPDVNVGNQFNVKSQTVVTAYVGQRDSVTSENAPTPVTGANVTLQFAGNAIKLAEQMGMGQQAGLYTANSQNSMNLTFAENQMYTFNALLPGDAITHGGSVTAPTKLLLANFDFQPTLQPYMTMYPNVYKFTKNTDLTVTLKVMTGGQYWYVTVLRADTAHPDQPQQVYASPPFDKNPPTAEGIINFIVGTPPTSLMIPGSTFAQDGAYAVLLVAMNNGTPNQNTFLGSPLLAGSGVVLVLAVGNIML